ncbi:MAG: hypothetical protein HQL20_06195 [Candidatus Omnitrophica bacterium]|nr:hypothetical protein [Candidatus Omnitrophota bacterium]
MKSNKNGLIVFLVMFAMGVSLFFSAPADAWWGGRGHDRGYPRHERYPAGRLAVELPHGFIEIGFGGRRYYYNSGLFYTHSVREYVVVPPPEGIVVYQIPEGWHRVMIDGQTYYSFNGVYYTQIPQGYRVVQPPAPVVVEPTIVAVNSVPEPVSQDFTVNIPDKKGKYVTVVIKRSADGFIGPQGEFYPEFPKVAQLQAMYLK